MSGSDHARAACIVGTARRTWNDPSDPGPEPLAMWEEVARAAIDDVGTGADVAAAIDHLGVVHCQSWSYDDPVARLADRLGRPGLPGTTSIMAGTSPQRLLDAAAERMAAGELSAALVVGGEALASRRRHTMEGTTPPWSHPHPSPPRPQDLLDEWYLATELRHGVIAPWLAFALLDQARWAHRGALSTDREEVVALLSHLSEVAAGNPDAWSHRRWSPADLRRTDADNRPVATPYTKHMVANPDVDMASANLLVTHELADAWAVPPEHRVYLRGWGFARDPSHLAARDDLASSPAMRAAQAEALAGAGMELDEVDAFDLYSPFGSALSFAIDALGLADDDPRPLTLTGAMPYYGGPGSDFMGHSIGHAVERIRSGRARTAMVTGIGMHMAKHVAAVYSVEPGTPATLPQHQPQVNVLPDERHTPAVVDHVAGPVSVEAATVVHLRDGRPDRVVAVCGLPDGRRCYAHSDDRDVIATVLSDAWVKAPGHVTPNDDGTHHLDL